MKNTQPEYAKLVEYYRGELVEQVHYGIILHINKNGIINKSGNDNGYKFYHRSCMKPLQAAVISDLNMELDTDEIAVCCASHTGDLIHREKVLSVLNKFGFTQDDLLCKPHLPLSIEEQKRLIKNNIKPDKIHNNCSGKHALMLAVCKKMGFPVKNYNDLSHPISELIINNVCMLCEVSKDEIIISKDGCTLPVIATSLEALGRGFLNLFTSEKYKRITQAYLTYPYLIGGNYRLDSEIINASTNLVAKVGACGLCVVVNLEKNECLVVKIADSNMEARAFAVINALLQIKWLDINDITSNQIKQIYIKEILSQDKEVLGRVVPTFSISR